MLRIYLNNNIDWFGQLGMVNWPGKSPDLTPLDLFPIKASKTSANVHELRGRIVGLFM